METLIFVLVAGGVVGAAVLYWRAYQDARVWTEVHAVWGAANKARAEEIYAELTRLGIRARLKTLSAFDITRSIPQNYASIRVHRDDFARAAQIVQSLKGG